MASFSLKSGPMRGFGLILVFAGIGKDRRLIQPMKNDLRYWISRSNLDDLLSNIGKLEGKISLPAWVEKSVKGGNKTSGVCGFVHDISDDIIRYPEVLNCVGEGAMSRIKLKIMSDANIIAGGRKTVRRPINNLLFWLKRMNHWLGALAQTHN